MSNENMTNEVSLENVKPGAKKKKSDVVTIVLCFVCAVILWFYVVSSQTIIEERRYSSIPVEISSVDRLTQDYGMTVISGYDYMIDVTVSGKKSELSRISADEISAYVDVSQVNTSGEHLLSVHVSTPNGISVKELSSDSVRVYVDKRTSKYVKLEINTLYDHMESGLTMGIPTADVEKVTITGPDSLLDTVDFAQVTVNLGKVTASTRSRGAIKLISNDGSTFENSLVQLNKKEATVFVPVFAEKSVKLAAEYKYGYFNENNSDVTIKPSSVVVIGDPSELAKHDVIYLKPAVDEKNIVSSTHEKEYDISFPDGIESADGTNKAKVKIVLKNSTVSKINVRNINVKNAGAFDYNLMTESVNVTLRGDKEALEMISSANIGLEADLSFYEKGDGRVTVPLSVILPINLVGTVYEIGEYEAVFNIK